MQSLKMIKPAVVLCIICLVMTGLVSLTFEATRDERQRQEEAAANLNRQAMYPEAAEFEVMNPSEQETWPDGLLEWTQAYDSNGDLIGHVLIGSKRGYAALLPVMVAIDPTGVVLNIRVLSNEETPGLGKKVEQSSFTNQFADRDADHLFSVEATSSDTHEIDAVSGATISSRAVADAVNTAIMFFQTLEQEGR